MSEQQGQVNPQGHTNKAMTILAVEGLDKAGKHTATGILCDFFASTGMKVERLSFPDYESPFGRVIKEWLNSEAIPDKKTFELLQSADKQYAQSRIQAFEEAGVDILVVDRYIHTEWAYGAYENDMDWLKELSRYMRMPDRVVYLDVEPEVSMHRRGKFGDADCYESDVERLRYTQGVYRELLQEGEQDGVICQMVDANLPHLIVKAQLLKIAGEICHDLTGCEPQDEDILKNITEDEAAVLLNWGKRIGIAQ